MPHVTFVPFTGLRVRENELRTLGMSLPGLQPRAAAIAELPALGLLTLAGMIPDHWTCSYLEAQSEFDALVERVVQERPTIVAVSALTASVLDAYAFCDRLRRRQITTVMGGLHVTVNWEEAQQHADAVVIGEGEPVWQQVLADAERQQLQPVYRAAKPYDLAQAPLPRFALLGSQPRPRMTLQTERGCPFACEFCGASRLLGSYREKPVDRIRRELQSMTELAPAPWLELADDNTFADRRDSEQLLQALTESNARYFTEADWRIGERPEILRGLARSGCVQLLVGIESLEFRYPGMGAKGADLERMMDAVRAIQEAGVCVNGCVILGADGETQYSIDRLIEFLLESPFAEIQITLQTPFPGTGLYRRLERTQRLLPDRDWSYYTLFDVTYRPDRMSVEELEIGFRRVLEHVFSREAHQRRSVLRRNIWHSNARLGA